MTVDTFQLLKRALKLSPEERTSLACSLIDSLENDFDPSAESDWMVEIDRRIRDLDAGDAKTVPWEEVQRRITARLARPR
jgi:putative addiction module component (TIGR02574 family)